MEVGCCCCGWVVCAVAVPSGSAAACCGFMVSGATPVLNCGCVSSFVASSASLKNPINIPIAFLDLFSSFTLSAFAMWSPMFPQSRLYHHSSSGFQT